MNYSDWYLPPAPDREYECVVCCSTGTLMVDPGHDDERVCEGHRAEALEWRKARGL